MTIKEFAETIGVSATTVSRAMNGRGRLSPATRSMVLERMQELGFTPNLNAQRLSDGRTYLVAIDFGSRHDYLSDMYLVELTRGFQDLLEPRGYGLLLSGPGEVFHRWVKTRAVDGVILVGESAGSVVPLDIARAGTPCVAIGHHPLEGIRRLGSVVTDVECGARKVARMLVEFGHVRVGFIGSTPQAQADVLPHFRNELALHGVDLPDSRVRIAGPTHHGAENAMKELMSLRERPTAVFARTDLHAAVALRCANRMGFRVPEDVSIVGHDDVPLAQLVDPPLTTVRVDCMEIARAALDVLFAMLDDPETSPPPQIIPTELVVRDTVTAPPVADRAPLAGAALAAH